jgi:hypothetical protein
MKHLSYYRQQFTANKEVFKNIFSNIRKEQLHWRQSNEKWNLLEIVCHLLDEEKEDFKSRLKSVLEDPTQPFASIDPAGWVKARNYNEQDYESTVQKFLHERDQSVKWLQSLASAKWDNAYNHPTIGPMSTTFIIANWLAHDYLHIRQITKLKYDYLQHFSGESLGYAGTW